MIIRKFAGNHLKFLTPCVFCSLDISQIRKRAKPSIPSMIPPITLADRQLAIDTSRLKPSIYPLSTLYLPSIYPQEAFRFCL